MSTLRIHGIEAKSDPTSASVNEKIKITNSSGELLFHLDGTQSGIGTVGITTTGTTFHVDRATQEITFVSDAKFNGTVGIAGTLTYEDVSNIDSVGLITARSGINLTGGNITLGDSGGATDDRIVLGAGSDLSIMHDGTESTILSATGGLVIKDTGGYMRLRSDELKIQSESNETYIEADANGSVQLFHNNVKKLETSSSGVTVTGTLTATSFSGSGASPVGGATTNTVFYENDNSVDVNYSVTSGKNAMSAGPIEIKSGITVTVPSGSFWTIV